MGNRSGSAAFGFLALVAALAFLATVALQVMHYLHLIEDYALR